MNASLYTPRYGSYGRCPRSPRSPARLIASIYKDRNGRTTVTHDTHPTKATKVTGVTGVTAVTSVTEKCLTKVWRISVPGREPFGLTCIQGTTREALLDRYPRGTRVEPQR